jgi:hypothetical protein
MSHRHEALFDARSMLMRTRAEQPKHPRNQTPVKDDRLHFALPSDLDPLREQTLITVDEHRRQAFGRRGRSVENGSV